MARKSQTTMWNSVLREGGKQDIPTVPLEEGAH